MNKPAVGRIVHYIATGEERPMRLVPPLEPPCEHGHVITEYEGRDMHRAAIVTYVSTCHQNEVSLHVMTSTGTYDMQDVEFDSESKRPGTWHWPERDDLRRARFYPGVIAMEGAQSPPRRAGFTGAIDYQEAAERLLANLAAHCQRKGQSRTSPIQAGRLCWLVFPGQFRFWQHETRRRRIRDTAVIARRLLAARPSLFEKSGQGLLFEQPTQERSFRV